MTIRGGGTWDVIARLALGSSLAWSLATCSPAEPPAPPPDAGCGSPTPTCPSTAPSFSADVLPILESRCAPCHGPGGVEAGRPLVDYASVHASRTSVLTQVFYCKMPPAGASPLTADEKLTILSWLACEAPNN